MLFVYEIRAEVHCTASAEDVRGSAVAVRLCVHSAAPRRVASSRDPPSMEAEVGPQSWQSLLRSQRCCRGIKIVCLLTGNNLTNHPTNTHIS